MLVCGHSEPSSSNDKSKTLRDDGDDEANLNYNWNEFTWTNVFELGQPRNSGEIYYRKES